MGGTDVKLFYEDPSLARVDTSVVEAGEIDGRPWVRLRETVFFPEGGGQPADRGTIAGVSVLDVQSRGSEVLHFLASPVPMGRVVGLLDAERRLDHRQQHTAQHLLTAVVADRLGMPTTSFHLGAAYSSIDVAGDVPGDDTLRSIEAELNGHIRRDVPVSTRWVDPEEIASLGVRSRGLPEGHTGRVRIVEIEGIDRNTCGGTHVSCLAEIQAIHLVDAEAARGGARIRFLAGGRVLSEISTLEGLERELKARIGSGREDFLKVVDLWRSERKKLEKRVEDLEASLAGHLAREIAVEPGVVLRRLVDGASAAQLRALATSVLEKRPEATVVLVGGGTGPGEASFLVQSGSAGPPEVAALGDALRSALGGKGGGRGRLYQGSQGTIPADPSFLARIGA